MVLALYKVTKRFPSSERFGIVDQIRRAVSSMTANIAEGWGRFHFADRARFYYQARGSGAEVQNFLILARDLGYLSTSEFKELYALAQRCLLLIGGLIRSTEKQINLRKA